MLTFNQLLAVRGLDPREVRIVRHRDPAPKIQRAVYESAMTLDPRFAQYQARQGTPAVVKQFQSARYLAGFVAEPMTGATVFVGIWERLEERATRLGNPFAPDEPASAWGVEWETRRLDEFDRYSGRLVIDWGDGTRAWVQRADNQDKSIVELRREKKDPDFPGYMAFQLPLDQVEGLYTSWVQALRSVRGIYLLVRRKTGEQYVGSAAGDEGFFGRWLNYQDGHGGNVGMRELAASADEYDVNILEVVASTMQLDEIIEREKLWKLKLGTRATGLNRN